jgi:surfeit locus 1 family protein
MIKTLFTKRYILTTILVLAAMAVMIRLGVWQLDRRQQRLAFNADVVAKLEQPPRSLNDAALGLWAIPGERAEIRNTQASASGSFDFDHQVVLVQQPLENRPGAHLVVPLRLEGSDQAVLVDRGWIPEEEMANLEQFKNEPGPVTINGFLQPSQILFGRAAKQAVNQQSITTEPQESWYRLDIEALQAQIPYQLLPAYLLQSPPPEGNLTLPIHIEPEFDLTEGSHMSYALQWFSFAAIAGIIYLSIVHKREGKQKEVQVPVGKEAVTQGVNHA